jgi:hypothetical protein
VLPYKFLGWHKVNVRLIPFILLIATACVAQVPNLTLSKRTRLVFLATMSIAIVAANALLILKIRQMDRVLAQYVSGVEDFEPNSLLLPIHLENPAFGQIRPLTRAHEYYHLQKGGANGKGLAGLNTLAMMWYRHYPIRDTFPTFKRSAPEQSLRRISGAYDYVLVWGIDPALSKKLAEFSFECIHQEGRLQLYRNGEKPSHDQLCPVEVINSPRLQFAQATDAKKCDTALER